MGYWIKRSCITLNIQTLTLCFINLFQNSVRHNLSLNKCFAKVDNGKTPGSHTRKGCLWGLNPLKVEKMEDEIVKWRKKDPESVRLSMSKPGKIF